MAGGVGEGAVSMRQGGEGRQGKDGGLRLREDLQNSKVVYCNKKIETM